MTIDERGKIVQDLREAIKLKANIENTVKDLEAAEVSIDTLKHRGGDKREIAATMTVGSKNLHAYDSFNFKSSFDADIISKIMMIVFGIAGGVGLFVAAWIRGGGPDGVMDLIFGFLASFAIGAVICGFIGRFLGTFIGGVLESIVDSALQSTRRRKKYEEKHYAQREAAKERPKRI